MSWKLFAQIALLMVIATILLLTLKFVGKGIYSAKHRMAKASMAQCMPEGMGNRGMMKGGYVK